MIDLNEPCELLWPGVAARPPVRVIAVDNMLLAYLQTGGLSLAYVFTPDGESMGGLACKLRNVAIDPHRPVEGVTLWNEHLYADRQDHGAYMAVDGVLWLHVRADGSYALLHDSARPCAFVPRRSHNPKHTRQLLSAIRDAVRGKVRAALAARETQAEPSSESPAKLKQ
jgi:hypothetical protein